MRSGKINMTKNNFSLNWANIKRFVDTENENGEQKVTRILKYENYFSWHLKKLIKNKLTTENFCKKKKTQKWFFIILYI